MTEHNSEDDFEIDSDFDECIDLLSDFISEAPQNSSKRSKQ